MTEPRDDHEAPGRATDIAGPADVGGVDDALVGLAALAADVADDPALHEWLARDARLARSRLERRRAARAAAGFADALLAARAATRAREAGVVREGHAAVERPAPVVEPLELAVARAAAAGCAAVLDLRVAAGDGRQLWDQACERWVTLPDALPTGRYLAVGVAGDSMLPLLAPGDTLLVRLGAAPAPGAIVVARGRDDGYVVKQVGRVTARSIELRSLNAAYAPFRVRNAPGAVLGVVVLRWRGEGARGT